MCRRPDHPDTEWSWWTNWIATSGSIQQIFEGKLSYYAQCLEGQHVLTFALGTVYYIAYQPLCYNGSQDCNSRLLLSHLHHQNLSQSHSWINNLYCSRCPWHFGIHDIDLPANQLCMEPWYTWQMPQLQSLSLHSQHLANDSKCMDFPTSNSGDCPSKGHTLPEDGLG